MHRRTHLELDPELCGQVQALAPGRAVVAMTTMPVMRADEQGLVHGGFVSGLADHAAMLAINEPTVVLGSASLRFVAPVVVGDRCVAEAILREQQGKKHIVDVTVRRGEDIVLTGELVCFVPPRHVLQKQESST